MIKNNVSKYFDPIEKPITTSLPKKEKSNTEIEAEVSIIKNEFDIEYYNLKYFDNKNIPEDSVRVNIDVLGGSNRFYLKVVSFQRPDGAIVIVVTNTNINHNIAVHIKDEDRLSESFNIEPKSVQTLIWH